MPIPSHGSLPNAEAISEQLKLKKPETSRMVFCSAARSARPSQALTIPGSGPRGRGMSLSSNEYLPCLLYIAVINFREYTLLAFGPVFRLTMMSNSIATPCPQAYRPCAIWIGKTSMQMDRGLQTSNTYVCITLQIQRMQGFARPIVSLNDLSRYLP
jgi:hypothetical protein